MAKMFEAWETSCLESTKINLIARRVVNQWSRATIFLALSSWHENVLKVKARGESHAQMVKVCFVASLDDVEEGLSVEARQTGISTS